MRELTNIEYLNRLKSTNPRIRSLEEYTNLRTKIKLECLDCGNIWKSHPRLVIENSGCPICSINKRSRIIIEKARDLYIDKLFLISPNIKCMEKYKGSKEKILHGCKICGHDWYAKPNNLLSSRSGCPWCRYNKVKTEKLKPTVDYLRVLKKERPDIRYYDYRKYKTRKEKRFHRCEKCENIWNVSPQSLLNRRCPVSCPVCSKGNTYSKISIEWLNSLNIPDIRHAENSGEHRINLENGKYIFVDGYDPISNTIYEFLGDCWHGNLSKFKNLHECHPYNDKTARELYDETMIRFADLERMGYKIIYIWETDYIKMRGNKNEAV